MSFAAKQGDRVVGTDIHIVVSGNGTTTSVSVPFSGTIRSGVSTDVLIGGKGAAVVGSVALNEPPHVPPHGTFAKPPTNQGTVMLGSMTVLVNGKPAARAGDPVLTCNDPVPAPTSVIVATGTVMVG